MPVSNFFLNKNHQSSFEKNGFLQIELASASELSQLQQLYEKYFSTVNLQDFTYSNFTHDKKTNFEVQEAIKSILLPQLDKFLANYRTILGLFYIKPSGNHSKFYVHRDWSIVNENKYSSLNIWLPLVKTTAINGNIVVVPGSHLKKTFRGSPSINFPKDTLIDKFNHYIHRQNIYTLAGEAVLFDHRLVHSSKNNTSGSLRIVAALSVIPKAAKVIHYHQNEKGVIEMYEVEDSFYLHLPKDSKNYVYKNKLKMIT